MIPNTGSWAKFTFINKLETLNGIYQITSVESFSEAINRGVDFYTLFYQLGGLTQNDWKSDYATYNGQDVYWLQSPTSSETLIPVPSGSLAVYPDLNVDQYYNLNLLVTVGLYKSPDELSYLASQINDIVSATTGQTSNVYWTASKAGAIYKTKSDYNDLDTSRKANAKELVPLITQVNMLNRTIDDLKAQNSYLQQALIQALTKKS